MSAVRQLPIEEILVRDRHRKDLGDLSGLIASIRESGLLQPIVVNSRLEIVAGVRRLAAWQEANPGQPIPVYVVELLDNASAHLKAERDENICRKALTPTELINLGRALEEIERPLALARMHGGRPKGGAVQEPVPNLGTGSAKTRDKVAKALGVSTNTYERAKGVVSAANNVDLPSDVQEIARQAQKAMDETGKVDAAGRVVADAKSGDPLRKLRAFENVKKLGKDNAVGNSRTLGRRRAPTHILKRVCEQLDGLSDVLTGMVLTEIESAEAIAIADHLSRFRSVLSKTINQLRSLP